MRRFTLAVGFLAMVCGTPAVAGDGVWSLRERYCLVADGKRGCGRGTEELMFFEGRAFYREGSGDSWVEIGTVGTSGSRFTVQVTREGVGAVIASRVGVNIADLIQDPFRFTYQGKMNASRIWGGRVRINLRFEFDDTTHTIKGGGSFRGRRVGDAYPVDDGDVEGFWDMGQFLGASGQEGEAPAGALQALGETIAAESR